jgi:uncharacterized protein YbcI
MHEVPTRVAGGSHRGATTDGLVHHSTFDDKRSTVRVTQGQLDAVAARCRSVLDESLQRTGSGAVAALNAAALSLRVEHSLAAAEHQLMRRATGRELFQHYVEELAEQIYPDLTRHIESILPYAVTYSRVKVDCEGDCIVFTFGLRPRWG